MFFIFFITSKKIYSTEPVIDTASIQTDIQNTKLTLAEMARQYSQNAAVVTNTASSVTQLVEQTKAITGNLKLFANYDQFLDLMMLEYEGLQIALPSKSQGNTKLDNTVTEDVGKLLEGVYSTADDPRQEIYAPIAEKYHGDSLKSALQISESTINSFPRSVEEVSVLTQSSDSTQSIKEAADVQNRVLVEILIQQQKNNMLLAQLVRAIASEKFRGTTQSASKLQKTYREGLQGSSVNTSNEVFQIDKDDLPFKNKNRPSVFDKIMSK